MNKSTLKKIYLSFLIVLLAGGAEAQQPQLKKYRCRTSTCQSTGGWQPDGCNDRHSAAVYAKNRTENRAAIWPGGPIARAH